MIITEKVLVKMSGKSISHYIDNGYNCKVWETIEVDIKDLLHGKIKIIFLYEIFKDF